MLGIGQREVYYQLRYRNQVPVNIIGIWRKGMREPLWVMSNLAPERALEIYLGRMKIEEAFRDLKSLLGLDRLMNKTQHNMEQLAALTMIAYVVGLLVGEALRDELYGLPPPPSDRGAAQLATRTPAQRKWQRYSGLFILLRQKLDHDSTAPPSTGSPDAAPPSPPWYGPLSELLSEAQIGRCFAFRPML